MVLYGLGPRWPDAAGHKRKSQFLQSSSFAPRIWELHDLFDRFGTPRNLQKLGPRTRAAAALVTQAYVEN